MDERWIWLICTFLCMTPSFISSVSTAQRGDHSSDHYEKCSSILTPEFGNCSNQLKPPTHVHEGFCSTAKVCHKHIRITRLEVEPFVKMLDVIVDHVLGVCCGVCRNAAKYTQAQNIQLKKLNRSILNTSNIVFPVLGVGSALTLYGYHYIPLIKLSAGYYVSKSPTPAHILEHLMVAALNLWPLLVTMLLMAFIAGFLVWTTDTWANPEDFPRKFFVGIMEGFWWAFVSMTTVGYGDKTPKFVAARLFSILWILIGITICSMFTAALTNVITSASNPPDPDMHGKTVGVLKYRTFDATSVAKFGGVTEETSGGHSEEEFLELKSMLTKGSVDGIFLDKYTFMHVVSHAVELKHAGDSDGMETAEFFLKKTTHTRLEYTGEIMTYGMLVREEDDYSFLHQFVEDNHAVYESCITLRLNALNVLDEDGESHDIFSVDGGAFYPTLAATLVIAGLIIIFGIFFEFFRTRKNRTATTPAR